MNVPQALHLSLCMPHPRPTPTSTSLTPLLSGLNLASSAPTTIKTEWGAAHQAKQSDIWQPPIQSLKTEPMDHKTSSTEGSISPWSNSSTDSDVPFPKIIKICSGAEYIRGCSKRPLEEETSQEPTEEKAKDEEATFHKLKKVKFELPNEIDPIQPRKLAFSPDPAQRRVPKKRRLLVTWKCGRCTAYFSKQKDYNNHACKPGPVATNSNDCY